MCRLSSCNESGKRLKVKLERCWQARKIEIQCYYLKGFIKNAVASFEAI